MTEAMDSSSSSTKSNWTYDVFLSFRGEDTRTGFTGSLAYELRRKGINTFIDDKKLERGEEISSSLVKAIEESRIAIIILSENYANSSWCLDELLKILECKKKKGQIIQPVFYKVDISEVRHQRGSFGKAMVAHEEKYKNDMEKVQKWKSALKEVANTSGLHIKDRYDVEYIEDIIKEVSKKLNRTLLHVADHPIGLESRISKIKSLLEDDESSDDVRMVGIHGLGGMGKSTIVRAVYNLLSDQFKCKSFLANIRENSTNKQGLANVQQTLLSDMLGDENNQGDVDRGITIMETRLCNKKVLLILDDVDKLDQLEKLVGRRDWFGSGSSIIITTRDKHLLARHGVENTYELKELEDHEALELFSWNAFKKSTPKEGFMDISKRAVRYSQNLPLALEIIGSDLFDKSIDEWKSTLDKYKKIPNNEILSVLRISYDNLGYNEKQVFLDIACFLKGFNSEVCKQILHACDFHPTSSVRILIDKSLIKIKEDKLWMHDLTQELGREIIRQESPSEPGKRSRVWFHKDALQVLMKNKGTEKIEGILLSLPEAQKVQWNGDALKKMTNLRIIMFENAYFSEGPKHIPNSLRVLDWSGYPSPSLPLDFYPENLVILNLPNSRLTLTKQLNVNLPNNPLPFKFPPFKFPKSRLPFKLPNNHLPLSKTFSFKKHNQMIYMNFKKCASLKKVPDLSGIPNLRELNLNGCWELEEIHDSVGFLDRLVKLSAKGCYNLEKFPSRIILKSLEYLNLRGCSKLKKFPDVPEKMEKIIKIDVGETAIEELSYTFGNLVGLVTLCLSKCKKLSSLSISFLELGNLKELDMEYCLKLEECLKFFDITVPSKLDLVSLCVDGCDLSDEGLHIILTCFPKLTNLSLSRNKFESLPKITQELVYLENLVLNGCENLKQVLGIPPQLKYICALHCNQMTPQSSNILLSQGQHEIPNLNVFVPGTEIPEWLDHCSQGASMSFWVRNKFPVIAVCMVCAEFNHYIQFQLCLLINSIQVYVHQSYVSLYQDHVNLFDLRTLMSSQQWLELNTYLQHGQWNLVQISLAIGAVKWCGVHVYKKESNIKNVAFTSSLDPIPPSDDTKKTVAESMDTLLMSGTTDVHQDSTLLKDGCHKEDTDDKGKDTLVYTNNEIQPYIYSKIWSRGISSNTDRVNSIREDESSNNDNDKKEENEWNKKSRRQKIITLAQRMQNHVELRAKSVKTVMSTVSMGTQIFLIGGTANLFKIYFGIQEGEELLNASQCYLIKTSSPTPGLLFISNKRVVFLPENREYQVLLPKEMVKTVKQEKNLNKPVQRYIDIIFENDHKYRFFGFLFYEMAFKHLQKALSKEGSSEERKLMIDS
ncbi:Disease resistance-like protein [Quillaja saponaria]|uniref:Disease resistance-like protein n=1 Tax=Quillaja saponaria TaxID=32244 RepID=A0AAD7LLN2_QUISA|nr:Disease resistance-like protein [Quillaja saponaria]